MPTIRFDPPPCPCWCQGHTDGDGWLYRPSATTKTCTRVVEAADDCDGGPVVVIVERFAAIERGRVIVGEPMFRLHCATTVPGPGMASLAATFSRLVELVGEPTAAA